MSGPSSGEDPPKLGKHVVGVEFTKESLSKNLECLGKIALCGRIIKAIYVAKDVSVNVERQLAAAMARD